MDSPSSFRHVLNNLRTRYEVPDLIPPRAFCIFILESPHVQELKYGAPVSGPSGLAMSKQLFQGDEARVPLGRLLKDCAAATRGSSRHAVPIQLLGPVKSSASDLARIGLMNVCTIPLQASAYPEDVRGSYQSWFDALEKVRTANQRDDLRDERLNAVQSVITEAFRARLKTLLGRPCTLVPCGRFAEKFLRLADVSDPQWRIISDVPHPSYNAWSKKRYRPSIDRVRQAVAESP